MTDMDNVLTYIGLLLLFAYFIFAYLRRNPKRIPGPLGIPILGSAFRINPRFAHLQFYEFAKTYGKIFEISFLNIKTVILNDVEMVEKCYVRDGQYFNNRADLFISEQLGIGGGFGNRNPDREYRLSKKLFIKSLHMYGSGTQKFEDVVSSELRRLLNEIDDHNGGEFEVSRTIKKSIYKVMSILLIGKSATDMDFTNLENYLDGLKFFLYPMRQHVLSMFPFLKYLPDYQRRFKELRELNKKVFAPYLAEDQDNLFSSEEENGVVYELKRLRQIDEEFAKISDKTIETLICSDMLGAGVISTWSIIPSAILFLVHYPEYQLMIQEEIDTMIGFDREPSLGDRQACTFLEAVVLETLRTVVPAPFSFPHVCRENRIFEGYHIKADTQVFANIWFIHNDEKIWGDPWNFRPERFIGEDGNILPHSHKLMKNLIPFGAGLLRCPGMSMGSSRIFLYIAYIFFLTFVLIYSLIPFGVGLRRCPGMSMGTSRIFLYIAYIFQRYTFEPVPGKVGSCDTRSDNFVLDLTLAAKPFYCRARRRQHV